MPDELTVPYEYDIFLSYQRDFRDFAEILETELKRYVREELGLPRELELYRDVSKTGSGAVWHEDLRSSLARSRVLVPLYSKVYFASEWCRREMALMLARQEAIRMDTQALGGGLIAPGLIYDGEDLPAAAKRIQHYDLKAVVVSHRDTHMQARLEAAVRSWAEFIGKAWRRAPEQAELSWADLPSEQWEAELHLPQTNPGPPRML